MTRGEGKNGLAAIIFFFFFLPRSAEEKKAAKYRMINFE